MQSNPTFKPGTHIPALDGVRGIAILLVMFHHFVFYGGMQPEGVLDKLVMMVANTGWAGVDLFFVLSGFLITGILLDSKDGQGYFSKFYARRFLRIFPLYYGFLLVFFVVLPRVISLPAEFLYTPGDQAWYWTYLVNLRITWENWPTNFAIAHFWSLAVEEQFYLFWPLVIFLIPRRWLGWVCAASILASLGLRVAMVWADYRIGAYVFTLARMDALTLGGLLAWLVRRPGGLAGLLRWAWPVVGLAGGALSALVVWQRGLDPESVPVSTLGFTLLAFFFGAVLVLALGAGSQSPLGRVFNDSRLRFFGRYSYGLYVFHHPIMLYLERRVFSVGDLPRFAGSQLHAQALFIILAGGLSVIVAVLSWHLFEAQFLKLKPLFDYRPPLQPAPAAQGTAGGTPPTLLTPPVHLKFPSSLPDDTEGEFEP